MKLFTAKPEAFCFLKFFFENAMNGISINVIRINLDYFNLLQLLLLFLLLFSL